VPEWTLRFDGLYEPRYSRKGIATYGFVVERDGGTEHEERGLVSEPSPIASAHVAEFGALIRGLEWLHARGPLDGPLTILGDSRLAIETVAGRWNLTSQTLLPLRNLARRLVADLGGATLRKVSRDENARADELSRTAYHEAVAAHPEWGLGPKGVGRRA
jgi:ribonuclease HI